VREAYRNNPSYKSGVWVIVLVGMIYILMKPITITTNTAKETKDVGFFLASEIKKSHLDMRGALVIALEGDLGGGKTTFTQGFAKGLGIRGKILSPTFVIMKSCIIPGNSAFKKFIHIDAYRTKKPQEILNLGWKDLLKEDKSIILVEWADKIKKILPKSYIRISFEFVSEKTRKITVASI